MDDIRTNMKIKKCYGVSEKSTANFEIIKSGNTENEALKPKKQSKVMQNLDI
jgi:hypothetical protein